MNASFSRCTIASAFSNVELTVVFKTGAYAEILLPNEEKRATILDSSIMRRVLAYRVAALPVSPLLEAYQMERLARTLIPGQSDGAMAMKY